MPTENALTLLERDRDDILHRLPSWLPPDRWWSMALEVARNPQLAQCSASSLLNAIKRIAEWGLDLDGEEAVIIPYDREATPTAMVRGLVRRAVEAGAASHIYAELVCENDRIEIISGTQGRELRHTPVFPKRGKVVGGYAVAILPNGLCDFELFDQSDIEAVKKASMRITKGKLSPAWINFEGEQIKKSVIRRLCKRLRGKREGEAGERFAHMKMADTRFEKEAPKPDDLPRGEYPNPYEPGDEDEPAREPEQEAPSHSVGSQATPDIIDSETAASLRKEFFAKVGGVNEQLLRMYVWNVTNRRTNKLEELRADEFGEFTEQMGKQ